MRVYGMVPQLPPEGKMGWHVAVDRSFQSTATFSSSPPLPSRPSGISPSFLVAITVKLFITPSVLRHNQWLCLDLHLVRALRSLLEQDMVQVL